ncbi:hypothetical protein S40293_08066 [Stachybotrys chartarum IBT 40293]|nr:hypothetical protein S40293_08066 [Stachybotrys chartarum IBT 40293]
MIDTDNLRTASLYINNQLLSRGLLRDGQTIDFAGVGNDEYGAEATMGRIIGVVNDLILRRDVGNPDMANRDAEQRESLSSTMRALRAENLKHTNDIARLKEKHAEAKRKLDIAETSASSLRTQMKSAEAAIRGLKEEIARSKALVAQARSTCAADVRKRDRQIDTLKRQLGEAGRARGTRNNSAITTITVTGDVGAGNDSLARARPTAAEEYSLRDETNAFLANLAQNLSEENEALLRVMRQTMEQLRQMSGWSPSEIQDGMVFKQPIWQDMATDLDSILDHLRTILTNPSFVPIEEVMVREEEIARLKDGWVKMESRWKEAVHLIDGWRRRMASNGRPVCEEELRMGLRLSPVRVRDVDETKHAFGMGLSAVMEEQEESQIRDASPCPSIHDAMHSEHYDEAADHSDAESSIYDDEDGGVDDLEAEEPNIEILQQSTATEYVRHESLLESSPLPEPPQLSPLRNSSSAGNRGPAPAMKPRQKPGDFTTILEENTLDMAADAEPPQPPPHRSPLGSHPTQLFAERHKARPRSPVRTSLDDALLPKPSPDSSMDELAEPGPSAIAEQAERPRTRSSGKATPVQQTPRRGVSRLPLRRNAEPAAQQSPLTMATIAAKLAASERDADAARVRAKLKAVRGTRGTKKPTITAVPPDVEQELKTSGSADDDVDPVKHDPRQQEEQKSQQPEKRKRDKRTSKAASRRRSTLSPWELESLISGNVQLKLAGLDDRHTTAWRSHTLVLQAERIESIAAGTSNREPWRLPIQGGSQGDSQRSTERPWDVTHAFHDELRKLTELPTSTASRLSLDDAQAKGAPGAFATPTRHGNRPGQHRSPLPTQSAPAAFAMRLIYAVPATAAMMYRAWSRQSLTPTGIFAAILTAAAHAYHPWNLPFVLLFVFFLAGTRVTHVKESVKASMTVGSKGTPGGEGARTHVQVLANSLMASILTVLHANQLHARADALMDPNTPDPKGTICYSWGGDVLLVGVIANYAAVAADTFSSELGILSKGEPRLITSWNLRKVPRGTNGGVSLLGLGAGVLGSLVIVSATMLFLPSCSPSTVDLPGGGRPWTVEERREFMTFMVIWGALGSVLDSVLGGLFQRSVKDVRSGKIVEGEGGVRVLVSADKDELIQHAKERTEAAASAIDDQSDDVQKRNTGAKARKSSFGDERPSRVVENGWDLLDNNDVNFIMAVVMSVGGMAVASWRWGVPIWEVMTP